MRKLVLTLAVILNGALVACGGDSTGLKKADILGTWNYTSTFSSSASGTSCSSSGQLQFIDQGGGSFTGTQMGMAGTCTDKLGHPTSYTGIANITQGLVNANNVAFATTQCEWSGTVNSNTMTGTLQQCTLGSDGYLYSGQFQATRQ